MGRPRASRPQRTLEREPTGASRRARLPPERRVPVTDRPHAAHVCPRACAVPLASLGVLLSVCHVCGFLRGRFDKDRSFPHSCSSVSGCRCARLRWGRLAAAGGSGSGLPCRHPNTSVQTASAPRQLLSPLRVIARHPAGRGLSTLTSPESPRTVAPRPALGAFCSDVNFCSEHSLAPSFSCSRVPCKRVCLDACPQPWTTQGPGPDPPDSRGGPDDSTCKGSGGCRMPACVPSPVPRGLFTISVPTGVDAWSSVHTTS